MSAAFRPGWIYFALFSWTASQGRFTALFLQERLLSEHQIGILLSLNYVVSIVVGPLVASWSDALVLRGYTYGHTLVIGCCAVLTSIFFLCQSIPELEIFESLDENHLDNRFYFFAIVRSLYSMSQCSIYSIFDGVTLEHLVMMKMEKSAYGNERLFGAVSWAIVSFTLGIAIDHYQTKVMYFYNICLLFPLLGSLYWYELSKSSVLQQHVNEVDDNDNDNDNLEPECHRTEKSPNDVTTIASPRNSPVPATSSSLQTLLLSHLSVTTVVFLVLCTVLSMGTSIVENLVFLLFTNTLGSSNFICGFSVVVTVLFEIPLFFYATKMLHCFGPVLMMMISGLAYATRVVGYTFVPASANWLVLCLEPLHGVTYGCLKIASVEFVSKSTPAGYDVTVQGILSALQNVGSLVGASVGGYVDERYGSDVLYRGAAGIVMLFLSIFVSVFCVEYRRKRARGDDTSSFIPDAIVELMTVAGRGGGSNSGVKYSKIELNDSLDTLDLGVDMSTDDYDDDVDNSSEHNNPVLNDI